jgi:hypothetical protein
MDRFTRRIIGFGVHAGDVDGMALCRMFNKAIPKIDAPESSWLFVSSILRSTWYVGRSCRPPIIIMEPAEDRKRDDLSADRGD